MTWTESQIETAKKRYDGVVTRVQKRRILLVMAYLVGRHRRNITVPHASRLLVSHAALTDPWCWGRITEDWGAGT
jgi:hypothetical protein